MRFKRLLQILPLMLLDCACILLSGWVTSGLLMNLTPVDQTMKCFLQYSPILAACTVVIYYFLGLYAGLWQYAGMRDVMIAIGGAALSTATYFIGSTFWLQQMKQGLEYYCLFLIFLALFTVSVRMYKRFKGLLTKAFSGISHRAHHILLIGAGEAAHTILSEIGSAKLYAHSTVVGIVDDNPMKHGLHINGYKIIGGREMIPEIVKKYRVDTIIFGIPSCKEGERRDILKICQSTGCELKTLPTLAHLPENFHINQLRNVEIEDLLGRDPIRTDLHEIMKYVENKRILVTGGGGSIGSELCRQIAAYRPAQLIIFDIYENTTYEVQLELKKSFPSLDLQVRIGSICDEKALNRLMADFRPHIIYHAAAHKHVPLMEDSPAESVRNNVFGTLNVARAADQYNAERFVMISTDKAVNPTNVMGATKRICEMIVQSYEKISKTEFVAVRFGNVLGSHGSVIPLFRRQLQEGGPLTVTHPDIIRYFMTIPEAVSLVLQAGALAHGGEIFVLDMGEPVKIVTLAENLIRLSGLEPYKDVDIVFTGLRPGEKLYEELLMGEEGLSSTQNKKIFVGKPITMDQEAFFEDLEKLRLSLDDENTDVRAEICKLVPTYHPIMEKK
ncbi:MAG: polysaccharide biosynthesis protein [Clostridia bacterium]|nr:polysaccharide biosynthesis protein [Clostridia bacterium]